MHTSHRTLKLFIVISLVVATIFGTASPVASAPSNSPTQQALAEFWASGRALVYSPNGDPASAVALPNVPNIIQVEAHIAGNPGIATTQLLRTDAAGDWEFHWNPAGTAATDTANLVISQVGLPTKYDLDHIEPGPSGVVIGAAIQVSLLLSGRRSDGHGFHNKRQPYVFTGQLLRTDGINGRPVGIEISYQAGASAPSTRPRRTTRLV